MIQQRHPVWSIGGPALFASVEEPHVYAMEWTSAMPAALISTAGMAAGLPLEFRTALGKLTDLRISYRPA